MADEFDMDMGVEVQDKQALQIWRSWKTVHELVQDRGYELSEEELNMSFETFKEKYLSHDGSVNRGLLRFSARPSADMMIKHTPLATRSVPEPAANCGPIYVEFLTSPQTNADAIRKFVQHASTAQFHSAIAVSQVPVTSAIARLLRTWDHIIHAEAIHDADLIVNRTHHELVPRHVLLSPEEKAALLKRYRLRETQLPRILASDAVSQYLGLRRGNVVKIIRYSETAGRYASYRLCA